jgi:hypothetical protein
MQASFTTKVEKDTEASHGGEAGREGGRSLRLIDEDRDVQGERCPHGLTPIEWVASSILWCALDPRHDGEHRVPLGRDDAWIAWSSPDEEEETD